MKIIVFVLLFIFVIDLGDLEILVESLDGNCAAPPAVVFCDEPKQQYLPYGFISNSPLFTDADIKVKCKKFSSNILKPTSTKMAYEPFAGDMACDDNEIITGVELCFEVDLTYIAPLCTQLEDGYAINYNEASTFTSNPERPDKVECPGGMGMTGIALDKTDEGSIFVRVSCADIVET